MCRTKQMRACCFCVRGRACCAAGVCALGVLRAFCSVLCSAFLGALGVLSVLCKLYICCFAGRCRCAWCMILRFAVAFACHFLSHSRIARSLFLHEYYKQISAIRVLYPSFVLSPQNGLFVCGRTGCVYWLRLPAWVARLRRTVRPRGSGIGCSAKAPHAQCRAVLVVQPASLSRVCAFSSTTVRPPRWLLP